MMKHYYELLGNVIGSFKDTEHMIIVDKDSEKEVFAGYNNDIIQYLKTSHVPYYFLKCESRQDCHGKFHLYLIVRNLNNLLKLNKIGGKQNVTDITESKSENEKPRREKGFDSIMA